MAISEEEFRQMEIGDISHRDVVGQTEQVLLDKALDAINGISSYPVVERYAQILLKDDQQRIFAQIREGIFNDSCSWVSYWASQGNYRELEEYLVHGGDRLLKHLSSQELHGLYTPFIKREDSQSLVKSYLEREIKVRELQ